MNQIVMMDNAHKDFYAVMGRFLSRRDIVKELGNSVWDDDGKMWFIALSGKTVLGWAAAVTTKNTVKYCSDYVLPNYRNTGVYAALFAERDKVFGHVEAGATLSQMSLNMYLSNGFQAVSKRGNYTTVKRRRLHNA